MNSKRAKKLLKQARKNGRTGKVIIGEEYNRLKKEHKSYSQNPKQKLSRRQQRRKDLVVTKAVKDAIGDEVSNRMNLKFKKPPEESFAPKSKAHRWPRVRIQTKFGYRTL